MAEVYKFVTPEGQEHAWHGKREDLPKAHPGAVITGRLVMNDMGEGSFEPYDNRKAAAAERKAAKDEAPEPAPKASAKPAKAAAVVEVDVPVETDQP